MNTALVFFSASLPAALVQHVGSKIGCDEMWWAHAENKIDFQFEGDLCQWYAQTILTQVNLW